MAHKTLASMVLGLALGVAVSGQPQPRAFFKDYARLSDSEIQKIEQGQVVTKVLGSTDTYGMLVFGAVYINAPIEKFAASFRDVKKLKENKVYLDVQEFSPGGASPKLFDFERLVLDKKDIDELHTCKPGECDLQVFDDIGAIQKKSHVVYASSGLLSEVIFPRGFGAAKVLISNKQLYSTRYMRVALQMYYCVPDAENPAKPGFFLIEMNDSRLPDFGGLKLAVVRKVATGKGVESTKDTLSMFYNRLNGK